MTQGSGDAVLCGGSAGDITDRGKSPTRATRISVVPVKAERSKLWPAPQVCNQTSLGRHLGP